MSFIRTKQIPPHSGNFYDYEVMTVHKGGKVIQKHIQYLGRHGSGHHKPLIGDIPVYDLKGNSPSFQPVTTKAQSTP